MSKRTALMIRAHERGRQEERAGKHDDIIAGVIAKTRAEALKEGAERGRQEERWACWSEARAIAHDFSRRETSVNERAAASSARVVSDRIAARGPMRAPEEE